MNRKTITEARAQALRFVSDANAAIKQLDEEVAESSVRDEPGPGDSSYGSAATGQLRRTSLDLTRSLARMRKP